MSRVNVETQTGSPYIGFIKTPKPYVVCNIRNRNLPPRNGRRKKHMQTDPRYFEFIEDDIKSQRERLHLPQQVSDCFKAGTLRVHLKYIADPTVQQPADNLGRADKTVTQIEKRCDEKHVPGTLESHSAVKEITEIRPGKFLFVPVTTARSCNEQAERKIEENRKNYPKIGEPTIRRIDKLSPSEKIVIRGHDRHIDQDQRPWKLRTYSAIEEALRCHRLRALKPARFDVETQTTNPYIGYIRTPKSYITSCETNRDLTPKFGKKDKSTQTEPSYFKFLQNDIQSQRMLLGDHQQVGDNFKAGTVRIHLPYIAVPTFLQPAEKILQGDNSIIRIDDGHESQARKRPRKLETDLIMEEALQCKCSRTRVPTSRPRTDQDREIEIKPEELNNNTRNRL